LGESAVLELGPRAAGVVTASKWGHSPGGHSPRGGNGNDSFGCQNGNRGMRPVFRGKWHVFRGKWRHFRGKIGIPPIPTHSPRPGNRGIFPPFPQLLGEWPHLAGCGGVALSNARQGPEAPHTARDHHDTMVLAPCRLRARSARSGSDRRALVRRAATLRKQRCA